MRLDNALAGLRKTPDSDAGDATARKQRAMKLVTALVDEVSVVRALPAALVAWVEGPPHAPLLRLAPLDVAGVLTDVWEHTTAVLTSATIPAGLVATIGMPADTTDTADVGSPFDYRANALLYCPVLPDPRSATYAEAMHDELAALITAAGGRTMALFTSWRAMEAAAAAMRERLDVPVLDQRSLPKPALVARFAEDEATCLFATMGFWQGVDVAGPTLSLVTIDRLPFPRPNEPLLQARREQATEPFATIDIPRAAMLLAQGVGRLIRTATDRGVVAVLDPRLATANYRRDLLDALPPMRRSRTRSDAEGFLRELAAADRD
jgi:ATP-dependent DNA helicase DinG